MGIRKPKKNAQKHIFAYISLTRNSRNIVFASVLPTRVLSRAEKVASKQFQLRDIVMGRSTPAGRLAPPYPMLT